MDSSIVEFKGRRLKATPCEPFECEGCFFDNSGLLMCNSMNCQAHTREDKQDVIFVEVKHD